MIEIDAQGLVARIGPGRGPRVAMFVALSIAAAAGGVRPAAAADASPWVVEQVARARLIAAEDALSTAGEIRLGLQIRMPRGWKTYWRSPGEAGVPTELDGGNSKNLGRLKVSWPLPKRFFASDMVSYGYKDEVVLPIVAWARDSKRPLDLDVKVRFGVCRQICVPLDARLRLTVAPAADGTGGKTAYAGLIALYRAQVPPPGPVPDLGISRLSVSPGQPRPVLEVAAHSGRPFARPDAFVEGPGAYMFGTPVVSVGKDRRRAVLRLPVYGGDARGLDGVPLRITLFDHAGGAVELVMTATGSRESE